MPRRGRGLVSVTVRPVNIYAWVLHADQSTPGRWLLLALVLCLVGDLLLLSSRDGAFGAGLAAFLLAHLAFVAVVVSLPRRDALLAAQRFRRPLPAGRLAVMVTYHVALAAVVVGVLRPDVAA